ncbi:hypothetical protein XA68_11549 [Ophiocordyceps unilateralis]|uniref:Uncharacterized protein n=1 Tax=Ophiocordyceps unilateralis TaxID=268505 RepID=A0A2A9PFB6_OPHUN|nr:hypothetical protein XA68_11549 [Ophiocordyceps unilateralis]
MFSDLSSIFWWLVRVAWEIPPPSSVASVYLYSSPRGLGDPKTLAPLMPTTSIVGRPIQARLRRAVLFPLLDEFLNGGGLVTVVRLALVAEGSLESFERLLMRSHDLIERGLCGFGDGFVDGLVDGAFHGFIDRFGLGVHQIALRVDKCRSICRLMTGVAEVLDDETQWSQRRCHLFLYRLLHRFLNGLADIIDIQPPCQILSAGTRRVRGLPKRQVHGARAAETSLSRRSIGCCRHREAAFCLQLLHGPLEARSPSIAIPHIVGQVLAHSGRCFGRQCAIQTSLSHNRSLSGFGGGKPSPHKTSASFGPQPLSSMLARSARFAFDEVRGYMIASGRPDLLANVLY